MSYEYRIFTDRKANDIDLGAVYNSLKKSLMFKNVTLKEHVISVVNDDEKWSEIVGIELSDNGFFITANLNRKETETLFDMIKNTMSSRGIELLIEEE